MFHGKCELSPVIMGIYTTFEKAQAQWKEYSEVNDLDLGYEIIVCVTDEDAHEWHPTHHYPGN